MPSWLIQADDLAAKEIPVPEFIVEDMIPVGLSMLAAPPKAGKSFFALQAGLAITSGEPFLGRSVTRGSVLYLALEDNEYRLQRRTAMSLRGKPVPPRLAFALNPAVRGLGDGLEEQLQEWHTAAPNPQLIIIDTYGRVMPNMNSRSSEYQQQTRILGPLQSMALELGIGVLLIHHTNKGTDWTDPFERINGSTAQLGALDAALILDRSRGLATTNLSVTGRDFPEVMEFALRFEDAIWTASSRDPLAPLALTLGEREIINGLNDGHTSNSGLAAHIGLEPNALNMRLKPLIEKGYVERIKQGEYRLDPAISKLFLPAPELTEFAESQSDTTANELSNDPVEVLEQDYLET